MEEIAVHVEAEINLTESEQKVREAIENIFGPMHTQIKPRHKGSILQANASSQDALIRFHNLLQREHIRAAARAVLLQGVGKNRISFCLNKQVAHAGHISFSQEAGESPLGPIRVEITTENPRETINYLTYMTQERRKG
jgi:predicted RNA binding protein with dsRBD fold (UPF0201 family)